MLIRKCIPLIKCNENIFIQFIQLLNLVYVIHNFFCVSDKAIYNRWVNHLTNKAEFHSVLWLLCLLFVYSEHKQLEYYMRYLKFD